MLMIMNQLAEFRDRYISGRFIVKLKTKPNGIFILELYRFVYIPFLGKVSRGKPVQSINLPLIQLGFAQQLYISSFGKDNVFGRESKINFSEYKVYVMNGFMEGATHTPMDLLHASVGMAGELGEVLEIIKKHVFHKHEINKVKLTEELGDKMWYLAAFLSLVDISLADVLMANKAKLDQRYKNGRKDLTFRDTKLEYELMSNALNGRDNSKLKTE